MCWLTNACPSTTSVTVFFKSAPSARIGRFDGKTATALGAYPRERRRTTGPKAPARAIESSTRRAIGRSPIKKASAMPERRSSSVRVIEGDRFARTVRTCHHENFRRACGKQQMMKRRIGQHDAEFVVVRRDSRQIHLR